MQPEPLALSPAQVIVLRRLLRTPGKDVVKALVAELVARECWQLRAGWRGPVLVPGPGRPPARGPLNTVSDLVRATPTILDNGDLVREVREVGRCSRRIHDTVVREVLAELVAAGLVKDGRRGPVAIAVPGRLRYARTAAGERRLRQIDGGPTGGNADSQAIDYALAHEMFGGDVFGADFAACFDAGSTAGSGGGDGGGGSESGG